MKKKKTFLSAHPPQTRETLQDIGKHYSNILTALVLLLLCVILSLIVLAVKLSSHTYILTDGNRSLKPSGCIPARSPRHKKFETFKT